MTTGFLKSSKKKQKLYDKFLKRRTYTNEKKYKNYNKYFEVIKSKSKRLYYSKRFEHFEGDAKKTWDVIKEVIGKTKPQANELPKRLITNDKAMIADKFNQLSVNIGPSWPQKFFQAIKLFSPTYSHTILLWKLQSSL